MLKNLNLSGTRVGVVALIALALITALFFAPIVAKETSVLKGAPAVEQLVASSEAEASAGTCTFGVICGRIYHATNSERSSLYVTCDWGDKSPSYNVSRGTYSSTKCRDTDGFYIPPGCVGRGPGAYGINYGAGWVKIPDTFDGSIRVDC